MISDSKWRFRIATALLVVGSFLLVWLSAGVGIIGADGDPANAVNLVVVAIAILGAMLARGAPLALAKTAATMALALAVIAVFAIATGLGMPYSPPAELAGLYGFFIAVFLAAAWLFQGVPGKPRPLDGQLVGAVAAFAAGLALLAYMVIVEDEPGALPLGVLVASLVWYSWRVAR